mgnify:CR=1 FL=1
MLFAEFTENENCGFGPVITLPPLFKEPVYADCIDMVVSGGVNAEATKKGDTLTRINSMVRNALFLAVNDSPQS